MKFIKIVFITLIIIISSTASAQFKFGVKGGANFSNVSTSEDLYKASSIVSYNIGVMAEIKLANKLGLEVDVLYSGKGSDLDVIRENIGPLEEPLGELNLKSRYIDVPLILKIYTLKVISFQVGPQFSILTSAKADFFNADEFDFKDELESQDFSVVAGIGIDVKRVHVSARYNFGIVDISDVNLFDLEKNNLLTLSLGIWLKK